MSLNYIRRLQNNPEVKAPTLLAEFVRFFLWGVFGSLLIYVLLGFGVEWLAPRIPVKFEDHLGSLFQKKIQTASGYLSQQAAWQKLTDELAFAAPGLSGHFKVSVTKDDEANAFAMPGRQIIVTSALLDRVGLGNEATFILAHELGHYRNRDHLKKMGRALALYVVAVAVFGNDGGLSELLFQFLMGAEMKFSQHQEEQADLLALELLDRKYGQVGGAIDFFNDLNKRTKGPKAIYYFSTHPHPEIRMKNIKKEISLKGYSI